MSLSRTMHLNWCKERALEYARRGELEQALASFWSDIKKHPETMDISFNMYSIGVSIVTDKDRKQMEMYIQGFM